MRMLSGAQTVRLLTRLGFVAEQLYTTALHGRPGSTDWKVQEARCGLAAHPILPNVQVSVQQVYGRVEDDHELQVWEGRRGLPDLG